jgi:hypothetical protein
MAKQFKVLVKTGAGKEVETHLAEQGAGERGRPLILKAKAGVKYQMVEVGKPNNLAPDNIKAKRVGKNLHIMFETDEQANVIIDDYYSVIGDDYNAIIGKAENGSFYEYLTEDPTDGGLIPLLSDSAKAVTQALKDVPQINAMIDGNDIIENHFYDIGVAVGTDKGLMVPVVRDCDQLNTQGMARRSSMRVEAVRDDGREPIFRSAISAIGVAAR